MIAALCEAVPLSANELSARVARFYVFLCGKQQKVTFVSWQLDIVLDLFAGLLPFETSVVAVPSAESPPRYPRSEAQPPSPHEGVRAVAQLLYENGERVGTRFDDILPRLLCLADPTAEDMEARHAALDAVGNICLKNWAGLTDPQRAHVCSCLTRNFNAHWHSFAASATTMTDTTTTATAPSTTASGGSGPNFASTPGILSTERKILASATRGLACAVGKTGKAAAAVTTAGRGGSATRRGSHSGSRSRSRGAGSVGPAGGGDDGGGGGVSPLRTGTRSSALLDPRARVRLQSLALLEAVAVKDAKILYPHWALFLGGGEAGNGEVLLSPVFATHAGQAFSSAGSPVLTAGLISLMESDEAPQIRAAAAAAATALVKNAPLRMWMPPATRTFGGSGGSGGIGQRVASMMFQLQTSLVSCLAREQAPVLTKLCACSGALVTEMPYEVETMTAGDNKRCRSDFEGLLEALLASLATLMLDGSIEPSARIAASQAVTAALSTKEQPLIAVDAFLRSFHCGIVTSRGNIAWRASGGTTTTPSTPSTRAPSTVVVDDARLGPPIPPRAGSASDRSNRFTGRLSDRRSPSYVSRRVAGVSAEDGNDAAARSPAAVGGASPSTMRRMMMPEERGGGSAGSWRRSSPMKNNDAAAGVGASTNSSIASPLLPLSTDTTTVDLHGDSTDGNGSSDDGGLLVDRLISVANAPGQLRAEALCLLSRIGRFYPSHLIGHMGNCAAAGGVQQKKEAEGTNERRTWDNASALLLRCFADPDQNLRLHALKVLEALLLARAERAAAVAAVTEGSATGGDGLGSRARSSALFGVISSTRGDQVVEENAAVGAGGGGSGGRDGDHGGDGFWGDLVQKHLQRALEDPYHGVRAVACSCHGSLLDSDWGAFSDSERDVCLDKLLVATRDRAAGVNVLACRVIAGLMTMAGKADSSDWCRKPDFLGRCAARLEEMMKDPKATIRAQATLAVGNLSCSLHAIRSGPLARGVASSSAQPVSRPQLRSLCEGVLRLAKNEPDHSVGSAARALGYLAWSLDTDTGGLRCDFDSSHETTMCSSDANHIGDGVTEKAAEMAPRDRRRGPATTAMAMKSTKECTIGVVIEEGADTDKVRGTEDRELQDAALLTLANRSNAVERETTWSANNAGGRGGSGNAVVDQGRTGREAGSESSLICRTGSSPMLLPAVPVLCRWNCCIAIGILLSSSGLQARAPRAPWSGAVLRSLRRSMEEDSHLKVRTHATVALKAFPNTLAYGTELPAIFGGALRLLLACGRGNLASDPSQSRY
ncbi:unnamed protein product, partial [Sphacelaria rigidula]